MDEPEVAIKCRAEDVNLVRSSLSSVEEEYKKLTGKSVKLSISPEHITGYVSWLQMVYIFDWRSSNSSAGGVILSALGDRILCNNTLEARLQLAVEAALPKIRSKLFAETDE